MFVEFPLTTEDYILEAKARYGDFYDYSETDLSRLYCQVKIICKEHGPFYVPPKLHLEGKGCRICKGSKSEFKIAQFLRHNGIAYEREKTFDTCKNPATGNFFRYDFYLPKYNILLEYDGEYHFRKVHDTHRHDLAVIHDAFKTKWAQINNYDLIRITYLQDLKQELDKLKEYINEYK